MEEIRLFTTQACGFLESFGVKVILLACNVATVALEADGREAASPGGTPVIGIVRPAIEQFKAVLAARNLSRAAVVGMPTTIESGVVQRLITSGAPGCRLSGHSPHRLLQLAKAGGGAAGVDEGVLRAEAERLVRHLVDDGVQAIMLACTDLTFVAKAISQAAGPSITVVDPVEALVEEAAGFLARSGLRSSSDGPGRVSFYVSNGDSGEFQRFASSFLEDPSVRTEAVAWF